MKRLSDLQEKASNSSSAEFCHAHPYPVLVVLQVHEGNLVHRPPDHEATVSHRRLPWADVGQSARAPRKSQSLGQAARATMLHESEDGDINLEGLF